MSPVDTVTLRAPHASQSPDVVAPAGPATPAGSPDPAATASDFAWRAQAHTLLVQHDLLRRSAALYWTDLLLSAGVGWAFTAVYFMSPDWSAAQIGSFVIAGVLFYRAGTFIHEIVHMPGKQMVWFKRGWNALIGIPFLMPWIMYRNHVEHHNPCNFGTPDDGEYLPLAASPVRETLKYLAQVPLLPLLQLSRFAVIGPASWLHRGLREWTLVRASAAVSNPYYAKRFPKRDDNHLLIVEAIAFVYVVAIVVLAAWGAIGWSDLLKAYLLVAFSLGLNWVRNLAAHRYANTGEQLTFEDQFSDSINITGQTWLTVPMFPVGLRYHALHHLFPALPYHSMGKAHRLLMTQLPPGAAYREANRDSYFAAVGELWRSARLSSHEQSAMRRWTAPRSEGT